MASIRMRGVVKRFGPLTVIPKLDLDIRDKEFVVFVGPSGCGKSTLLRIIAGLEKANEGDIYIGDARVNDLPAAKRDVAMVFQDYALYPHMTVYRNMAFALEMRGMAKSEVDDRIRRAAEILHIEPYMERKPKALSGGQRQRVAMGRAMVRNPQVFLFDEPLSNLDAKLRAEVRTEIKTLSQTLQTTMIFVTHDQVEAMTMADRIVILKDGTVQQIGDPELVYRDPVNQFVAGFIGSPTMNFFRASRQSEGLRLADGTIVPIAGARAAALAQRREDQVTLGVRPEHLRLAETGKGSFPVTVKVVEPLGSDTLCYFEFVDSRHVARLDPDCSVHSGDRVWFSFDTMRSHVFAGGEGQCVF